MRQLSISLFVVGSMLVIACGGEDGASSAVDSGLAVDGAMIDAASSDAGPCADDDAEDDDDVTTARVPNFEDDMREAYTGDSICGADDDWLYVFLFAGETLEVKATFTQDSAAQDLDLRLYDGTCDLGTGDCTLGALLTPCTEDDAAGCDAGNGQSRDGDETLSFTATADSAGDHWVVVHGWMGSENRYDLCLAISPETCF